MAEIQTQKISDILSLVTNLTTETYTIVSESDGNGGFVTKRFDLRNVDNIREYNTLAEFPTVGRAKTLYIDKSNGKIYSWDGNQYLLLSVRIVDGVVSPDSTWSSEKINTTMAQKEHTHTEADITDLKNYALASHSHLASQITDFNTAVNNNTNVSLNTDARHTHTNKDVLDNTTASYTTAEKNKLADIENQYYNKTESDNKFVNKAGDTVTGDLVVQGNLTISGTTTTVDTEQVKINDNIVTLNSNFTSGTPTQNSGVEILRGDEPTVAMYWNEATDQWDFTGGIINATVANADKLDGNDSTYFATAANLSAHTTNTNNPHNVTAAQLGAANILTQLKTVDGAGSGLDADLLDGKQSTEFANAVHTHTIDDITDLNRTHYINIILDAGWDIIGTGVIGDFVAPACTITEAVLLAATVGSIEIELWKDTYDNFPPTSADKITATSPLKLVSAMKSKDTNLTGWTTNINQGDIIRVVVNSCEGISQCTLSLKVTI